MDKFIEFLERFTSKNRTLFFVVLAIVAFINLNLVNIDDGICINPKCLFEIETDKTFLIAEIILASLAIERFLTYINFTHYFLLRLPIISDLIFLFGYDNRRLGNSFNKLRFGRDHYDELWKEAAFTMFSPSCDIKDFMQAYISGILIELVIEQDTFINRKITNLNELKSHWIFQRGIMDYYYFIKHLTEKTTTKELYNHNKKIEEVMNELEYHYDQGMPGNYKIPDELLEEIKIFFEEDEREGWALKPVIVRAVQSEVYGFCWEKRWWKYVQKPLKLLCFTLIFVLS
jgi:hypothetical protein